MDWSIEKVNQNGYIWTFIFWIILLAKLLWIGGNFCDTRYKGVSKMVKIAIYVEQGGGGGRGGQFWVKFAQRNLWMPRNRILTSFSSIDVNIAVEKKIRN